MDSCPCSMARLHRLLRTHRRSRHTTPRLGDKKAPHPCRARPGKVDLESLVPIRLTRPRLDSARDSGATSRPHTRPHRARKTRPHILVFFHRRNAVVSRIRDSGERNTPIVFLKIRPPTHCSALRHSKDSQRRNKKASAPHTQNRRSPKKHSSLPRRETFR